MPYLKDCDPKDIAEKRFTKLSIKSHLNILILNQMMKTYLMLLFQIPENIMIGDTLPNWENMLIGKVLAAVMIVI